MQGAQELDDSTATPYQRPQHDTAAGESSDSFSSEGQ